MNTITQETSPIRTIWLFKILIGHLLFILILWALAVIGGYSINPTAAWVLILLFALYEVGLIADNALTSKRFTFAFNQDEAVFHQGKGILSPANVWAKIQPDANVRYSNITGVYSNRGVFEKIFGLEGITIQFMQDNGQNTEWLNNQGYTGIGIKKREFVGFAGSKVHIPGLRLADAESIKKLIAGGQSSAI